MKIIAFYLPQYHRIPENDKWWGEGYTDWIAVKNAKPLYDGHIQPHTPLNQNYYDLTNKETMEWQSNLMREYGVDALCFYHYWFRDGRMVLQQPAENLLKWRDIDMPFCFSWANETWARSWSGLNKFYNMWASSYEDKKELSSGVLLEQKYEDRESWEEHFQYLRPFFEDERYVRVDEKPIFLIHKPSDMYCLENMIECWQELAIKAGLKGIYFIGNIPRTSQKNHLDKSLFVEPSTALSKVVYKQRGPRRVEYSDVWKIILSDAKQYTDTIVSGFVGYDDTPRRGADGIVIDHASPAEFEKYLTELISINISKGDELFFINAWNEWGEGMYLEPDEDGYTYLQALKRAKERKKRIEIQRKDDAIDSHEVIKREKHIKLMLDQWLKLYEEGKSISNYLFEHNYKNIGIYGIGLLGKHLLTELMSSEINVVFLSDRNALLHSDVSYYSPDEQWPQVDAVIVTAVYDYGDVYSMIKKKDSRIFPLSLEHVLFEA